MLAILSCLFFMEGSGLDAMFKTVVEYDASSVLVGITADFDHLDRLLVVDNVGHTVHVWNADGTYLKNFGRKGQGPGEFIFMFTPRIVVNHKEKQVLVTDRKRINIFDAETHAFIRVVEVPYRWIDKLEMISSNRYLMDVYFWDRSDKRYYSELQITDENFEMIAKVDSIRDAFKKRRGARYDSRPWGPRFSVSVVSDQIVVAKSDEQILKIYNFDGEQQRAFRLPLPLDVITDQEIEDMRMLYYREMDPEEKILIDEKRFINRMVNLGDGSILAVTYRHNTGLMKGKRIDLSSEKATSTFQAHLGEQGSLIRVHDKMLMLESDEDGDWRIRQVEPILNALANPNN